MSPAHLRHWLMRFAPEDQSSGFLLTSIDMISDIPSTDDIIQKTHEELLTRIERTGVELTALAGKIRRDYESAARVPPDEQEPFLLLRQGMRELQDALEALEIPDIG